MESNSIFISVIKNQDRIVITTEDYDILGKIKNENKNTKIVSTHSGTFHGDEVLATLMTKYLDEYKDSIVIRSRNLKIHQDADFVCDVGGIFDATANRFDHHMKEFTEVFDDENKMKMSSAGLVYKFYGKKIIENFLKVNGWYESNVDNIDGIYQKLYLNFIMMVDGNDNGINQYPDDIKPKYVNTTGYSNRISRLNPEFEANISEQVAQFKKAYDIAEDELFYQIKYIALNYFPAYTLVKQAIMNRKNIHDSGKVIYLERGCPWKEILLNIETELGISGEILFAIMKCSDSDYKVTTVPLSPGSFLFRKGLPEPWRGLARDELAKVSKIADIIFVHSSGFIGGAQSYLSAIKIAEESLK